MSKWMTATMTMLASAFVALTGTSNASAQATAYSITVEGADGSNLPVFYQGGQGFVLGQYGERYNIRVRNLTARRAEAVVTVDGRDVVSGDPGDFVRQRGYVLQPYGDVLIEGFRQSMNQVAAFRFTTPGDSYSARRGTPQNVGVIGVAFFAERYVPRPAAPIAVPSPARPYYGRYRGQSYNDGSARAESRSAAPQGGLGSGSAASPRKGAPPAAEMSADAAPRSSRGYVGPADDESDSNIGTQYGESRYNQAREVTFVRANNARPDFITTLRYDDVNGLLARGIEVYPHPSPRPYVQVYPEAFPSNRFAPPPR